MKTTKNFYLARPVSGHLAPALTDSPIRGHRNAKIAVWNSADHAVPSGTFCCRHSGPLSEECSLPRSRTLGPVTERNALKSPNGQDFNRVLQATRTFHTEQPHLAPVPPLPEYGGKVRHGLIPEEFFQYLYPKTGVTGPYVLGTGLILYALSKEIYVITGETITGLAVIGLYIFGVKKFGPSVAAFADKLNEQKLAQLEEAKQASIKQIQDAVDMEKAQQALVQKRHYLFDVQRNNIALALEVTYRERLHRVYKEVKNRLDYHISVQNMMRRKEQEHMINWVEKHVVQSISAQQVLNIFDVLTLYLYL
uniref:ATP synthase subunit b n=1 Tax=Callithrix jacchus TaxID=9483 RepID=A0A8I4A1U1_CALJA